MKNLFLIDGASGTGKSDLLQWIHQYQTGVTYIRKFTTRKQRDYEATEDIELDLDFVAEEEFRQKNIEYQYVYSGFHYGFARAALEARLRDFENVFVIVRNADLIKRLQRDYSYLNVVPVYVFTDRHRIEERLRQQQNNEEQIAFRLKRIDKAFEDYLLHPSIYREILINNSSIQDYHRLATQILEKYKDAPDVNANLVFVMMSFNPDNPRLVDYYNAMKRAVESSHSSLTCTSLDDIEGSFAISPMAKNNIRNCRLAIVDLTENKPNVFYELGYVHGIVKECVLTAHIDTPLQFYPREYKIVQYKNADELERKLSKVLKAILKI